MTIVEEEIMDPNENLEEEMDDGDHDPYDEAESGNDEVEEDVSSDDDHPPAGNPEVAEWVSLEQHPAPTAARIVQSLRRMAHRGRGTSLTILMLGKASVGKSSTANSLFGTTVAQAFPFHMITHQPPQPLVVRKRAEGVTFTVIDTPRLVDSDAVSDTGLRRIALQARNDPVDVVLFLDRMDIPRPDELDMQMMNGLSRTFGNDIWSRVVIGLTRASVRDPGPSQTYDSMVAKRVEGIRAIMRKAGGRDAPLPYVLIENGERCRRNPAGEKVLENGTPWIPTFFEKVVELADSFPAPHRYNPRNVNRREILFARFCLIPLVLVAQVLFKILIVDRIIAEDGLRGDCYGPFEEGQKDYERTRMNQKKEAESKARREKNARRQREESLEDELSADSDEE